MNTLKFEIHTPTQDSSPKEWALWYAGVMHWHIFPIQSGQKYGFYRDDEHKGDKTPKYPDGNPYSWKAQATNDIDRIEKYWTEHPNANIGLATGQVSGVYVLDYDAAKPEKGTNSGIEVMHEWEKATGNKLIESVCSETQSGGYHVFYRADPKQFQGKDAGDSHIFGKHGKYCENKDGNDTRGTGYYIVLPPSKGQQGNYKWIISPTTDQIATANNAFYEYWQGGSFNDDGTFNAGTIISPNQSNGAYQRKDFSTDPGQSGRHNYLVSLASHDSALLVRKGTLQHDDFINFERFRNMQIEHPLGTMPDDDKENEWENTIRPHCEKVYAADDAARQRNRNNDFSELEESRTDTLKISNMTAYISDQMDKDRQNFTAYNNVETGFKCLTQAIGFNVYPALYAMVGGTSAGKTTFFLQVADYIASRQTPVLYFSLEQSRQELLSESMSRITNDNGHYASALQIRKTDLKEERRITNGTTTKDLKAALDEYQSKIAPYMYIIEGNFNVTVDMIRQTIKQFKEVHPGSNPVIFVDYLQILKQPDFTDTRAGTDLNITNLKTITRDENVPIFLISSTARGNYTESGSLDSFKESGTIEYSADVAMSLYLSVIDDFGPQEKKDVKQVKIAEAENENPRNITLKIMKNRFGKKNQKIEFQYYPAYYRFIEKGFK